MASKKREYVISRIAYIGYFADGTYDLWWTRKMAVEFTAGGKIIPVRLVEVPSKRARGR